MATQLEPPFSSALYCSSSTTTSSSSTSTTLHFKKPSHTPRFLSLQNNLSLTKPTFLPLHSPATPSYCSASALDPPQPSIEDPNPNGDSIYRSSESRKDRRKIVKVAWEKLLRWSRSWRSKTKTDVLERTRKVQYLQSFSNRMC